MATYKITRQGEVVAQFESNTAELAHQICKANNSFEGVTLDELLNFSIDYGPVLAGQKLS